MLTSCQKPSSEISLAGKWQFAMDSTDIGITEKWFERSFADKIQLPGTTDEAGYGIPNTLLPSVEKPQILHLTRKIVMSVRPGIRGEYPFHRIGRGSL